MAFSALLLDTEQKISVNFKPTTWIYRIAKSVNDKLTSIVARRGTKREFMQFAISHLIDRVSDLDKILPN